MIKTFDCDKFSIQYNGKYCISTYKTGDITIDMMKLYKQEMIKILGEANKVPIINIDSGNLIRMESDTRKFLKDNGFLSHSKEIVFCTKNLVNTIMVKFVISISFKNHPFEIRMISDFEKAKKWIESKCD